MKSGMGKTPYILRNIFLLKVCVMTDKNMPPAGRPARPPLQCQTNPPRRILVVDHDPCVSNLNAEVLIRHGYVVNTAGDGKAGWEALQISNYNLLITEHDMPGLTGLALVKKLRATRMALPVIMATRTLPTEDLFSRYPWLQPAAALPKPYTIEELLGTVTEVLRATDSARAQIKLLPGSHQPMVYNYDESNPRSSVRLKFLPARTPVPGLDPSCPAWVKHPMD